MKKVVAINKMKLTMVKNKALPGLMMPAGISRTAIREIPAGIIKPGNALFFTIVNFILFMATTFFINRLCLYLSPVALLVVLGYSYTKRFTPLCHLILGIGLSLAPIGAFFAVTGAFYLFP